VSGLGCSEGSVQRRRFPVTRVQTLLESVERREVVSLSVDGSDRSAVRMFVTIGFSWVIRVGLTGPRRLSR
jgi:hypothetical protein